MNHDPFIHRVIKRLRHLKKWATRSQITCFRVYHQDLPDYPLILDYYDGDFVLWFKPRKRDETTEQIEEYQQRLEELKESIMQANSEN